MGYDILHPLLEYWARFQFKRSSNIANTTATTRVHTPLQIIN